MLLISCGFEGGDDDDVFGFDIMTVLASAHAAELGGAFGITKQNAVE